VTLGYLIKLEDRKKRLYTWCLYTIVINWRPKKLFLHPLRSTATIPKSPDTEKKNHKPFSPTLTYYIYFYGFIVLYRLTSARVQHCRLIIVGFVIYFMACELRIWFKECYVIFSSLLLMSFSSYISIRVLHSPCRLSLFLVQFQTWKSF